MNERKFNLSTTSRLFGLGVAALLASFVSSAELKANESEILAHLGMKERYAPRRIHITEEGFGKIVATAAREGTEVNFGAFCSVLGIQTQFAPCIFKQIVAQDDDSTRHDLHGLGVPKGEASDRPFVLIYHISKLGGEIYIVSPLGELTTAFVRTPQGTYERAVLGEVRRTFEIDASFWISILDQAREDLREQTK
jgi:hypothetical protein